MRLFKVLQRPDVVHGVDRTSMRPDDEVVEVGLYPDVANRDGRHVVFETLPRRAGIEGHPDALLGSEKNEIAIPNVGANRAGPLVLRQPVRNRGPAFPEVVRNEDVRSAVARVMRVVDSVRRPIAKRRRCDGCIPADTRSVRRRNVLPVLAAVTRQLHEPIVGTDPDLSLLQGDVSMPHD